MDIIEERLLSEIADLHGIPTGAYNIRANGKPDGRRSTEHIVITPKTDVSGIDIDIKPGTKNESVHIPVILSETGYMETVYNDFYVGDDCDVTIIAGCGIHNSGCGNSKHDGIHRFHVGKNSKLRYVEKHYGEGEGSGKRTMNPSTEVTLGEDSHMEMEMIQIGGLDSTYRKTTVDLGKKATLVVRERLMTNLDQTCTSEYIVNLNGEESAADVVSRSVAKDQSSQLYISEVNGNTICNGHTECDAIIMDHAKVEAVPKLTANDVDAALIHEAAIGKIAGDQLIKLMTLGLTRQEAETQIINGFLK